MVARIAIIVVILGCFAGLFLACYAPVLFGDRQFGYRDAGHYYYPLYLRVQQEWNAGRWPLWEREENAGVPLLGNPTAAVLYPGKLVFAFLPYAWAVRAYTLAHTILAFAAMLILMRSWQTSWVGSGSSALCYAFGGPILFQSSNVIYLVGAAWLPLGLRAIDRWARLGRRSGILELAIVLAMQTLGGDPQSAYLLGWTGGGYAAGIAWNRCRKARHAQGRADGARGPGARGWWSLCFCGAGALFWVVATIALASWLPGLRPRGFPPPPLAWMAWVSPAATAAWVVAALAFFAYWSKRGWRFPLGLSLLGLAASGGLAALLAGAFLLPALEFMGETVRAAASGPRDLYGFALEPLRLPELVWPNILGCQFQGNTYWRDALALPGPRPEIWVPSLYLGGLALILALSAFALRRGPPWRVWLSSIVLLSLLGSLGPYTSPIWAARVLAATSPWPWLSGLLGTVGPLDARGAAPIRFDGFLRDGDGGFYWWIATVLPGFRAFRFPAKLFTFTALGLAALAGLGWDGLREARGRRVAFLLTTFLVLSLAALTAVWLERGAILTAFRAATVASVFGPFDCGAGLRAIVASLAQACLVLLLGLATVGLVPRWPHAAGILALVVSTTDLALANMRLVVTVPQRVLDAKPEVLRLIEEHERKRPGAGPFRIHRMAAWHPPGWQAIPSADRPRDMVAWERDTLQAKHAISLGVEYTHSVGIAELDLYEWFFGASPRTLRNPEMAKALGLEVGKELIYFPRRSFDLWNTRYFVIPCYAHGWFDQYRGYASFLFQYEQVYPSRELLRQPQSDRALRSWIEKEDFQVLRNLNEFPRSWVVHDARWIDAAKRRPASAPAGAYKELIYGDDPLWHDATMRAFDPRTVAWVEGDRTAELAPYISGRPPGRAETVRVSYPTPQRAELEATLESPGMVVLADVLYPGWTLTIDGRPASIYPVNGLMRGAAVSAGMHRLVYSYAPGSFRAGLWLSILGLALVPLLGVCCILWPIERALGSDTDV